MIYRFRIVLDTLDDVFRDLEIKADDTLEDLHNAIVQAFEFDGHEMASFYLSDDEWEQGEEIPLFDMSEGETARMMDETSIDSVVSKSHTKMIYVYDFMAMWTFYVELGDIVEEKPGQVYPNLMYSHGIRPQNPPDKQFESEKDPFDFDDDFDENDLDFDDLEDLEDFDFDQWN